MDLTIRHFESTDLADEHRIRQQESVILGTLALPYEPFPEITSEKTPGSRYLVADTQEGVIGLASLTVFPSPRMRHGGEIGMFVDENFQGQGVGSALLQALIDYSDNWLALIRIELTVYAGNEPAIALYKKSGFEIEGTKRNYLLRNGQYCDYHIMSRVKN